MYFVVNRVEKCSPDDAHDEGKRSDKAHKLKSGARLNRNVRAADYLNRGVDMHTLAARHDVNKL